MIKSTDEYQRFSRGGTDFRKQADQKKAFLGTFWKMPGRASPSKLGNIGAGGSF